MRVGSGASRVVPVVPVIALVVGAMCFSAAPAHGQSDEVPPPVAPLFAAQSPTPASVLTGLTTMVRTALAAAVGDQTAAASATVPPPSEFSISGVGSGHVEPSLTLTNGRLTTDVALEFASVVEEFTAKAAVSLETDVCPDADGRVRGQLELRIDASEGHLVTPEFAFRRLEADFEGRVDKQARLTSLEWGNEDRGGEWTTETHVAIDVDGDDFDERERETTVVDLAEDGDEEDTALADGRANAAVLGELIVGTMRGAREIWRDDGCVQLRVLEGDSTTIDPGDEVRIVLAPTSVIDDARLDVPVAGKFLVEGGERRLEPSRTTSVPAEFTFSSTERAGAVFELVFRSVSRYGIATQRLAFRNTGDLKPVFGRTGFIYSGVKCGGDPGGTWTIRSDVSGNGDPNGEDLTLEIDPETLRGTVTGTRFLTEDRDAPTQEIPVSGTVVYDPSADHPQLVITRTTGPYLETEYIGVNTGDFCEDGEPRPEELVPIDR